MKLFGCWHRDTTFPMTPKGGTGKGQTYVACLSCGRELPYDWDAMRIAKPETQRASERPATATQ